MSNSSDVSQKTFGEQLTSVPDSFESRSLMPGGYYVTNNDWMFGAAARRAADSVDLSSEYTSVYMTVGNGGFESMASLLPSEVAFLHIDKDPQVLLASQIARSAILESDSREEFFYKINSYPDVATGRAGDMAETWQEKYLYQRFQWSIAGRFTPWLSKHFLSTEKSFSAAREALSSREVAYFAMDIFDSAQRGPLGEKLGVAGARIAILNVTNVMDPYYNRDHVTVPEIVSDLPTSEELVIMQSTNKKRSRASGLEAPYKRDGAKVTINRRANLL